MYYGAASTLSQLAQLCQGLQQIVKSIIGASLSIAERIARCTISHAASTA